MLTKIMYRLGWVPRAHFANQQYKLLLYAHSAHEMRQAAQQLYDVYCPDVDYYPLDCAFAEYDKIVMGQKR